jgi:glyceraldehyde 3-phosphate dehydrogenase
MKLRSGLGRRCRPKPAPGKRATSAALTTGVVIPELAVRLGGVAVRVPVEDGSLTDLTAVVRREVTASCIFDSGLTTAA